ncbi:hypothetical protein T01_5890 [Trichinella spiralis]|uniref:Uncharacterized protein n=1 Tax=Trichinella spiralis TaxID=6334 RepID=A0A0V1BQL7_TRISP|nr:hypothetical protein T01_5890 [Trichinella spiralis]
MKFTAKKSKNKQQNYNVKSTKTGMSYQQYEDSEQSDVRTWRSLHLIHNCGKLVTQLEINSHLTSFQENRSAKEASSQEEEIQNNQDSTEKNSQSKLITRIVFRKLAYAGQQARRKNF